MNFSTNPCCDLSRFVLYCTDITPHSRRSFSSIVFRKQIAPYSSTVLPGTGSSTSRLVRAGSRQIVSCDREKAFFGSSISRRVRRKSLNGEMQRAHSSRTPQKQGEELGSRGSWRLGATGRSIGIRIKITSL